MSFLYVRSDEMSTLGAAVADTTGATDSDYTNEWMCDGRIGRPVRATNGTVKWTATFTSAEVGLVAVCNCNSDVNATIDGTVSGTVTAGTLQPNGMRLNGFQTFTPATNTTLGVAFSGAASAVVLGELIGGKYRTLTRAPRFDSDFSFEDYTRDVGAEFGSILPYDPALESRTLSGYNYYNTTDRDLIIAWWRSQRNGTKPSLIVPDSTVNDAWVVRLLAPKFQKAGPDAWRVDLTFIEYPRSRV